MQRGWAYTTVAVPSTAVVAAAAEAAEEEEEEAVAVAPVVYPSAKAFVTACAESFWRPVDVVWTA